nr:hypothetical protein [Streptomyces canus]
MTTTRRHLTRDDLAPLARAATGRALTGVTRLRGGSKKGVYRLALDDGTTVVAYVWSPDEDYWDAGPSDPRDPFSAGTGPDVFTAAHDRLVAAGVRTPRLLYADTTMDAVVVEDMRGGSLEEALERDPVAGRAALELLAAELGALHAQEGPAFGKVGLVDNGGTSSSGSAPGASPRAPCATSSRPPYGTNGSPSYGRSSRRPYDGSPQPSGRAPGTPSSTANSAPTTSCWTTRAGPPSSTSKGSCTSTSSGSTSSCASASDRSTTTSCAPPAWTRTG